jgi:predicted CXXCH cytochrome family protein
MPDQIKRLLVIAVAIAAVFLIARQFLIPESFGVKGHYRAAAVDSISALPIRYAGHTACLDCHEDVDVAKRVSYHRTVRCEACHGPGQEHINSMGEVLPSAPRDRGYCVLCHAYNAAKPTGYPQIDPVTHNPMKACIVCHNPHAPEPPRIPGDCSACHAGIARTKAVSPHALVNCTDCHIAPEEHKINPRSVKPSIPLARADCGKCHSREATSDAAIPRIDLIKHNEAYLCWQCHYPHNPESKKNEDRTSR